MDAVKFLKEQARMCKTFQDGCLKCPLWGMSCNDIEDIDGAAIKVSIVEEWSKGHPSKTRMSEFLKQYPNAPIGNDGMPKVCPCNLETSYDIKKCGGVACEECRKNYWLEEVE